MCKQPVKLTAARTTASHARRCLFGPSSNVDTTAMMSEWRKHYEQEWNFDFQRMTPLQGRYDWWKELSVQQSPRAVNRDSTITCGPSTVEISPPAGNSCTVTMTTSDETTTFSNNPATSGATPRRRRRRQTTINGSASSFLNLSRLIMYMVVLLARISLRLTSDFVFSTDYCNAFMYIMSQKQEDTKPVTITL